jgi:hypothetical protein
MIKNIISALKSAKNFLFSKRGINFYLILLLIQIPFVVPLYSLLSLFLVSFGFFGISLSSVGHIYLIYLVSLIFFLLNILIIGSIVDSIFLFTIGRKTGIFQSFKNTIKKFKKLVLVSFLIVFLNSLSLAPSLLISQESYNSLNSELQSSISSIEIDIEQVTKLSIYGSLFLDSLNRFGKPILPVSKEIVDLCIVSGASCIKNIFNLSNIFILLISLIFIFIFQEIMLTKQNLKKSIGKSFEYFKNNLVDILLVWLVSAFIFIIGELSISLIGYLIPIIPGYLGHVFAFLVVITFQTSYYLKFIRKYR